MDEPARSFRLSLQAMFGWAMPVLLKFAVIALAVGAVLALLLFFLARLSWDLILVPLMLSLIPVLLLLLMFALIILLVGGMYRQLMRYQITETGIIQSFGPMKQETTWLEIQGAQWSRPLGLEQLRLDVFKKDQPLVIYLRFLAAPDEFIDALVDTVPQDNPVHEVLKTDE